MSACLRVNQEYAHFKGASFETTPKILDSSTTALGSVVAPPTSTGEGPHSQVLDPSTSGELVSIIDASSSPETTSSASTDSSSSQTETSRVPEGYTAIEVFNPSTQAAIAAGTSISLRFDHAAWVSQGAQALGQDLHLFARQGEAWVELDRVLDPQSGWNRSDTRIWFATDREIPAQARLQDIFYLATPSGMPAPRSSAEEVFLLYDDFEAGTLSAQRWSVLHPGGSFSDREAYVDNGSLEIRVSSFNLQTLTQRVWSNQRFVEANLAMEAQMETYSFDPRACSREGLLEFRSQDGGLRAGFLQHDNRYTFANQRDDAQMHYEPISSPSIDGSSHRMNMTWRNTQVTLERDQTPIASTVPANTGITHPHHPSLSQGLSAGFGITGFGGLCLDEYSTVRVHWVLVRRAAPETPQVQLLVD